MGNLNFDKQAILKWVDIGSVIDKQNILQWVDIGSIIAFSVVLGLLLLSFIRGLFRGWKHGTYHLIFIGILAALALIFDGPIANALGGINLAQWIHDPINITARGQTISVEVTSLFETVYRVIYGLLHDIYQVKSSPAAIANYSIALAGSFLRIAVVVIIAIFLMTVGEFLVWVLWHLIFKRFIPKEKRKPKGRFVSALEEVVVYASLIVMAFSPLTGVMNAVKNGVSISDEQAEQNDTIALVKDVADTYEKSIFNQAFFAWTKGSGQDSFDTLIASYFAQNSYVTDEKTYQANFVKELQIFSGVIRSLSSISASEVPEDSLFGGVLHYSLLIGQTLYSMVDEGSYLASTLTPLIYDVADNIDSIAEDFPELGQKDMEFNAKTAPRAFRKIAQSDYLSCVDDPIYETSTPLYEGVRISEEALSRANTRLADDEKAREMTNAIVAGYVYGDIVNNPESVLRSILPDGIDYDEVSNIDWAKEAMVINNVSSQFHSLPHRNADSADSSTQAAIKSILDLILRDPNRVIKILVGDRDDKGEPVADELGYNKDGYCLLDSDLISTMLPLALEIGASFFEDSVLDENDPSDFMDKIGDIAVDLQGDGSVATKKNFKKEFGSILDVAGEFAKDDTGKKFLANYESHPGLDFAEDGTLINLDPKLCIAMQKGIINIDNSKSLVYMLPVVADHFTRSMLQEGGDLYEMGIKKLDFHSSSIGKELSEFLSIGVYCPAVISSIGSLLAEGGVISYKNLLRAMVKGEAEENGYQVTHLLDIFTKSKILNPEMEVDGVISKNQNVAALFNYILSAATGSDEISVSPVTLGGVTLESKWDGAKLDTSSIGENHRIIDAFRVIVETGVIDKISNIGESSSSSAIKTLSTLDVRELFTAIGKSQVLRATVPSFFDNYFLGTVLNGDKAMDLRALGITYANLVTEEDWANEGDYMQSILDLATKGLDISNLDFFSPDVIELMKLLAQSGMFSIPVADESGNFVYDGDGNIEREYCFPRFFTDKILLSLTSKDQITLICDYPEKVLPSGKTVEETLDSINLSDKKNLDIKKESCSNLVRSAALLRTKEEWTTEFDNLASAIGYLKAAGGEKAMSDIKVDNVPVLSITIRELLSSRVLGQAIVSDVFYKTLTSDALPEMISGGDINLGYLFRVNEDYLAAIETGDADKAIALDKARSEEVELLLSLFNLTIGNGAIQNDDGKIDIKLSNLSVDGMLRPLVLACKNSKLLNPTSTSELYDSSQPLPEFNAFKNIILSLLTNSEVFIDNDDAVIKDGNTMIKGTNKTLKQVVSSVDNWDEEVDKLLTVIKTIQDSEFFNGDEIDFSPLTNDLAGYFEKPGSVDEMGDLILGIESSELLYRCLAPKLEDALSKATASMSLPNIKEDLKCADFYLYEPGQEGVDFKPYSEQTCHQLISIFEAMSLLMKIDMSDLSTLDLGALVDTVTNMGPCPIFNENTAKSATIFGSSNPKRAGLTSFQCLLCDIIVVDSIGDYYYYAPSPKDVANASNYMDMGEKIAYEVGRLIPNLSTSTEAEVAQAVKQYISDELIPTLGVLKQDKFASFIAGDVDVSNLSEGILAILLHSLNDCTFYRDCVPNAFHKMVIADGGISVDGIDLNASDVYFSYYFHDGNGNFSQTRVVTPDFDMPFYSPEIDLLAMAYSSLKDNQAKLSNIDVSTIDPMLIRSTLLDLSDSYVFHLARKDNRPALTFDSIEKRFSDLTVFESFIYKVMVDTTLYERNYNARAQYSIALNHPGFGAYYKLHDDILSISGESLVSWFDEINAISGDGLHHAGTDDDPYVGLIEAGQKCGIFSSGSEVNVGFDSLTSMSPKSIKSLLFAINGSALLNEVLPNSISELLGDDGSGNGLSLNQYSDMTLVKSSYSGTKEIDFSTMSDLFDDGDITKSFHNVSKIILNATSSIAGGYHVYMTSDSTDVTSLVGYSYDSVGHKAILDLANLPGPYRVTFDADIDGDVELIVPLTDFHIGSSAFHNQAIPALGYFLASAYRGTNGGLRTSDIYFSFSGSGDSITSLFKEKELGLSDFDHSTYGIFILFSESGFYDTAFTSTGDFTSSEAKTYYTASEIAIHNILKFNVSAPITVNVDLSLYGLGTLPLPTSATLSIGDLIGKGNTELDHIRSLYETFAAYDLNDVSGYVREAKWFDEYAGDVATLDLYKEFYSTVFDVDSISGINISSPVVRKALYVSIDDNFAKKSGSGSLAISAMVNALSSSLYSYDGANAMVVPFDDEPAYQLEFAATDVFSEIGMSILANLVTYIADYKTMILDLEVDSISPSLVTFRKYDAIDDTAFTDDLFASDYALMTQEYLGEVATDFLLLEELYDDSLTAGVARGLFAALKDNHAKTFNDMFYLSALYDQIVAQGVYGVSMLKVTDFPMVNAKGLIENVSTPFSYGNVASVFPAA